VFLHKLLNRTPWGQRKQQNEEKNANIMIDVKKQIIATHENGVRVSDLRTQFGMAKSTICAILKNRETIKKADVARGSA
jgi:Mor family transcriptional regulator